MIQLSYQPAFDPLHAAFRFLRLREAVLGDSAIPRDHLRILDFYLLFPFRSDEVRVSPSHRRFKKVARSFEDTRPYGDLPDDRVIFSRMSPIQTAALEALAKKGLFDAKAFARGLIKRTDIGLPAPISERIAAENENDIELIEFLRALATEYELLGANGLKGRTGLMDFAYDAA